MLPVKALFILMALVSVNPLLGQRIQYSEPTSDDNRRIDFEIIGKVSGNFLVYKEVSGKHYISVYNNEMKELKRVKQDYFQDHNIINIDFFPYSDHSYAIYQYQKKSVIYCEAVKLDGEANKLSDIITIDTTHISFSTNNRIYTSISSENRNRIMVFKVNSRNRSNFIVTTLLLDQNMEQLKRSRFGMPMKEGDDKLDEFHIDNEGDLVFTKFRRDNSEAITQTHMIWKPADSDSLVFIEVPQKNFFLDEPVIKIDNFNNRFFLTSFYYQKKRGNIDGFYFYVWDKNTRETTLQNSVLLDENIRNEAKGDASTKSAFNDYFVRNVVIKKNGGFVINAEAFYTTSRSNSWNRYNYMNGMYSNSWDYYSYSPVYNNSWWRANRFNSYLNVRSHADNITILSFDQEGNLEWNSVIRKSQFDDETDDRISYMMANTGSQIHYLFNVEEKRSLLLNDYTLNAGGSVTQNPTLKNLDRGFEFMPKYGKQVSANQLIIPCYYRNYLCFAKVDFN
jgi:hypothetical protein